MGGFAIPPQVIQRMFQGQQNPLYPQQPQGAPADFGGPVMPNPNNVQPRADTDPGPSDKLTQGASMLYGNAGKPTMDTSNPPMNQMTPGPMQTVSTNPRGTIAQGMQAPMSDSEYGASNPDASKAFMPTRPVGDFDTGAHPTLRRALGNLFAGLAEFGGDINRHPGAGSQYFQRWNDQSAAQRQYDNPANQEKMKAGALNQAYQTYLQQQQAGANIPHTQAETANLGAQTSAIGTREQLEKAQTEAAYYKEDPNVGLIDVRTGKPVTEQGIVPLTKQEADVLGKKEGDRVPLKMKNTANEMVQRGVRLASANGRQLLIDGQGNTLKDLGQATPTMNVNLSHELQSQNQAVDEVRKNYATAQDADERLSRMEASYGEAKKGNQQAMLALLSDHIGMTMGLQKGARITKDIIQEAQQSAPWLARMGAKFDKDGYLSGVTLTPDQMTQMLQLGYGARDRAWTRAFQASQLNGIPQPPGAQDVYNKRKPGDMPALGQGGQGGGDGDVIYARDPQGKLHKAPKGTALPQGWKAENAPKAAQ
jgi:hypothetical protein